MRYFIFPALALALLAGGCASSQSREGQAASVAVRVAPAVLAALSGPDALLLTNVDGLQCRAVFTLAAGYDHSRRVSGRLSAAQGRLCFESDAIGKKLSGRFGIVWDTRTRQGFVTSEDLQGVAPITATNRYTFIEESPDASPGADQDGHPVKTSLVTLARDDGQMVKFRVWQAADLNALALRIEPLSDAAAPVIALSDIGRTSPPAGIFLPPDDFTKYAGAFSLLDELIIRAHNVYDIADPSRGDLPAMLAPSEMHNQGPSAPP